MSLHQREHERSHLRIESTVDAPEVAELFRRSGIRRPADDLDRIGRMIAGANLIVTARDGERLVGIARSLSDGSYACYLSDLAVDREYQRMGIGKRLVDVVREAIGDEVTLILIAAPEAEEYYPRIGFEPVKSAWYIPRRR